MQANEDWDGAPDVGGAFGPYIQSQRLPLYQAAVNELLAQGKAYRCDCTAERLAQVRKEQMARKEQNTLDTLCMIRPTPAKLILINRTSCESRYR